MFRPEHRDTLRLGKVVANPGVPVDTCLDLLVPEHIKTFRCEDIMDDTNAVTVYALVREKDVRHAVFSEEAFVMKV